MELHRADVGVWDPIKGNQGTLEAPENYLNSRENKLPGFLSRGIDSESNRDAFPPLFFQHISKTSMLGPQGHKTQNSKANDTYVWT